MQLCKSSDTLSWSDLSNQAIIYSYNSCPYPGRIILILLYTSVVKDNECQLMCKPVTFQCLPPFQIFCQFFFFLHFKLRCVPRQVSILINFYLGTPVMLLSFVPPNIFLHKNTFKSTYRCLHVWMISSFRHFFAFILLCLLMVSYLRLAQRHFILIWNIPDSFYI